MQCPLREQTQNVGLTSPKATPSSPASLCHKALRFKQRNQLMADILKHRTNNPIRRLLPQQQILNLPQRARLPLIHKMIPTARIAIQHRRRLDVLFPIRFAPLALERVVRIARRAGLELEQLFQRIKREMALDVLCGVDDAGGERLLV